MLTGIEKEEAQCRRSQAELEVRRYEILRLFAF